MMPKVGCMKYSNSKVMRLLGPPRSMRVPEQMNGLIRLFHVFDSTSEGEQVENTRQTATTHKTCDNLHLREDQTAKFFASLASFRAT